MHRTGQPIIGRAALEAAGVPNEFAAQVMLLAEELGIAIAIRAGQPFYLYEYHAMPKPPTVKAKIGNWGPTQGVIAADPLLGKQDDAGRLVNATVQQPAHVELIQHYMPLSQLLAGLSAEPPKYELAAPKKRSFQVTVEASHCIQFRALDHKNPAAKNVVFSVDLQHGQEPERVDVAPVRTRLWQAADVQKPYWWNDRFGDFEKLNRSHLPLSYASEATDGLKPVMIYGLQKHGRVAPITGDLDIMWISKSNNPVVNTWLIQACGSLDAAHGRCDTTGRNDAQRLEDHVRRIAQADPKKKLTDAEIDSLFVRQMGCITPFEAYVILVVNKRFAEIVAHIKNLFQHGPENRNPNKPADLQFHLLHIVGAEILLSGTVEQTIDLVTNCRYSERYHFDVHPQWDNRLWMPVIMGQAYAGQILTAELVARVNRYARTKPLTYGGDVAALADRRLKTSRRSSFYEPEADLPERNAGAEDDVLTPLLSSREGYRSRSSSRRGSVGALGVLSRRSSFADDKSFLARFDRTEDRRWKLSASFVERSSQERLRNFWIRQKYDGLTFNFDDPNERDISVTLTTASGKEEYEFSFEPNAILIKSNACSADFIKVLSDFIKHAFRQDPFALTDFERRYADEFQGLNNAPPIQRP